MLQRLNQAHSGKNNPCPIRCWSRDLCDAISISSEDSQPFIIGGGEIYKMAMSIADRIELTRVHADFEGDTFFPEIQLSEWKEVKIDKRKKDENHNYDFTFIRYDKI